MATPEESVFWIDNVLKLANISVSGLLVFIGTKLAEKFERNTKSIEQHTIELEVLSTMFEFLKGDIEELKTDVKEIRDNYN
jgi:hypothetical protein